MKPSFSVTAAMDGVRVMNYEPAHRIAAGVAISFFAALRKDVMCR